MRTRRRPPARERRVRQQVDASAVGIHAAAATATAAGSSRHERRHCQEERRPGQDAPFRPPPPRPAISRPPRRARRRSILDPLARARPSRRRSARDGARVPPPTAATARTTGSGCASSRARSPSRVDSDEALWLEQVAERRERDPAATADLEHVASARHPQGTDERGHLERLLDHVLVRMAPERVLERGLQDHSCRRLRSDRTDRLRTRRRGVRRPAVAGERRARRRTEGRHAARSGATRSSASNSASACALAGSSRLSRLRPK